MRVDGGEVEPELAGVFGLEVRCLELDDDVGADLAVVEEQFYVEVSAVDFDVELPTYP